MPRILSFFLKLAVFLIGAISSHADVTVTVTTTSTKGWTRETTLNSLGLPTSNALSGTGIPTTGLTPVWRADGSLASVSLNIGGETHSAAFNPDGTLSSLTAPGRGNILGGHSIANGVETLTVDGVTVESRLDGTKTVTGGGNVTGKTEELTAAGGLKLTVTPEVGEDTETRLNAAFAPTSKTYADDSGESYGYTGELLTSVSLARGGAMTLGYSPDSAKDLTSANWPQVTSGPFTIPGLAHGFTYNRAGQIKTVTDPSGARSLAHQNGRLTSTAYTGGLLRGYEIIRNHDTGGRHTGILLKRDGTTIHSTEKAPNGASDQITDLASAGITATPQRDAAGRITGYVWSDGTSNSVTQTWQRGAGGRIEFAGSDVTGAPTFDYLLNLGDPEESFDARNRRLKCATTGGTWTYTYGVNGQLTSAIHPSLGSFTYAFDAIGRRTDKGAANTSQLLNQTTAWTNSQGKKLTITAAPDARVWFNGAEISGFTGSHQVTLGTPGTTGQWIEWNTLAVLEGQGEGAGSPPANPLASPDAKAEKSGAVWVPPAQETLSYDVAGNRQSDALWDYGWNAKNELVRTRTKNYLSAPQAYDITYAYDAEGRRVRKQVNEYRNGAIVSQKAITTLWDGWQMIYERQQLASGLTTLERKYLWGPDIADGSAGGAGGLLLIQETKGGVTRKIIPLYDGTGHVTALTNINKELLATYAYGPFGEKITATGPMANSNPWRWGTKYYDEETGLYYFGKRYYDPRTGQWLSRELLGESQSANLYQFAGNDPINKVDVLGLAETSVNDASENWASRKFRELVFAMFPGIGAMASRNPQDQAFYLRSAQFQNNVTVPILRLPGQAIQATGNAITEGATDWGGNRIARGNSITGYGGGVTGGIAGQLVSGVGGMLDPVGMIDAGQDYFIVQTNDVWRTSGGGWNGVQAVARHDLTAWNVEKAWGGFASGDYESGWEGVGATANTALIFLAPQMQAGRLPSGSGSLVRSAPTGAGWWQRGGHFNPLNYRVPAGELYSGFPRLTYAGPAVPTIRHHIFNKFRGISPGSQKYRDFFDSHGIKVDDFTVEMPETLHKQWIHRAGNNWTTQWKHWIDANSDATTIQVYQQAGRMMGDFGINQLPLVPYR